MYSRYDREYYHFEVSNFADVSERLRELAQSIPRNTVDYDDYTLDLEYISEQLIKHQNRMFRALAREIRSVRNNQKGDEK